VANNNDWRVLQSKLGLCCEQMRVLFGSDAVDRAPQSEQTLCLCAANKLLAGLRDVGRESKNIMTTQGPVPNAGHPLLAAECPSAFPSRYANFAQASDAPGCFSRSGKGHLGSCTL